MTSLPDGAGAASGGWMKSSFSNGQCACVEIRVQGAVVSIRDSKYLRHPDADPASQPMITVGLRDFQVWTEAVRSGEPLPIAAGPLMTSPVDDGGAMLCHLASGTCLTYTRDEWSAWVAGVEAGSFVAV